MDRVELLLDARATIAESLLWEPGAGVLYWVDIKAPALYRLDPVRLANRKWNLPADIGAFALLDEQTALVALRTGLHALSLADGTLEHLAPPPYDPARFRFNEGACDAAGRFWVGCTFDKLPGVRGRPAPGPLSTWTSAAGLQPAPDVGKCHNGMGWSPDGHTFYLSHSQEQVIFAFPFDVETGVLGERREFARVKEGLPDGAAVDEEGGYWCAMHGAGRLQRFAPDGIVLRSVELPVSQPTMCAFGGPDLRTLFISSASDQLSPAQHESEPHAGSLFRFDPGVRGLPKACFAR